MKRVYSLVLGVLLLFSLSACGGGSPVEPIDGFAYHQNEALNIQFQYPEEWVEMNASTVLSDESVQTMLSQMNVDENMLNAMLQSVDACFYNMAEDGSHLNYTAVESDGETNKQLVAQLSELKEVLEQQYASAFNDLEWIEPLSAKKFGSNEYLQAMFSYNLAGVNLSAYQVMLIHEGVFITFTYTAQAKLLDEATISTLEQIVGSLETVTE